MLPATRLYHWNAELSSRAETGLDDSHEAPGRTPKSEISLPMPHYGAKHRPGPAHRTSPRLGGGLRGRLRGLRPLRCVAPGGEGYHQNPRRLKQPRGLVRSYTGFAVQHRPANGRSVAEVGDVTFQGTAIRRLRGSPL